MGRTYTGEWDPDRFVEAMEECAEIVGSEPPISAYPWLAMDQMFLAVLWIDEYVSVFAPYMTEETEKTLRSMVQSFWTIKDDICSLHICQKLRPEIISSAEGRHDAIRARCEEQDKAHVTDNGLEDSEI